MRQRLQSIPTEPIHVIGGGIAGLTLGRYLKDKGYQVILYEKSISAPWHNYGISLHTWAYTHLIPLLGLDEETLKKRTSVDGRFGKIFPERNADSSLGAIVSSYRANSGVLRTLLAEGLDIRYDHAMKSLEIGSDRTKIVFANGVTIMSDQIVAADGVHSQIRSTLLPENVVEILPFITFSGGRRRLNNIEFKELYAPYFKEGNVLQRSFNNMYLRIAVIERTRDHVDIGCIYSRPWRVTDPALKDTKNSSASARLEIPESFFDELSTFASALQSPFAETFSSEKLRQERVLPWIMRTVHISSSERQLLEKEGIPIIGDAAHGTSVLGGMGANVAIQDAIYLGKHIDEHGFENLQRFYKDRYPAWKREIEDSEVVLAQRHELDKDIQEV